MISNLAVINYTNHRGERAHRRIEPTRIEFTATPYHREPQWILHALDIDKQEMRAFALKDIHSWRPSS